MYSELCEEGEVSKYITPGQDRHLQMKATHGSNQYCVYDSVAKWHTKAIYVFHITSHLNNSRVAKVVMHAHTHAQGETMQKGTCMHEYVNKYSKFTSEMSHI